MRKLQRTLYRKAKAEPKDRFWSLYGDINRPDVTVKERVVQMAATLVLTFIRAAMG